MWDDGPYAPFTVYAADALLSASLSPDSLRRTRIIAGARPRIWSAALARRCGGEEKDVREAERVARELGFIIVGE